MKQFKIDKQLGVLPSLPFFVSRVSEQSRVISPPPPPPPGVELRFSLEAMSLGCNLLDMEWPAGLWIVDRPRRSVLNRVTNDALFLKLFLAGNKQKHILIFSIVKEIYDLRDFLLLTVSWWRSFTEPFLFNF